MFNTPYSGTSSGSDSGAIILNDTLYQVENLPPGSYYFHGYANFKDTGFCNIRLWDGTANSQIGFGIPGYATIGGSQARAEVLGRFEITVASVIYMEYYCESVGYLGYCGAFGDGSTPNIYGGLMLERIS
jgi:hypothetical protein